MSRKPTTTEITDRVAPALARDEAVKRHAHQRRRDETTPYITHLDRVAEISAELGRALNLSATEQVECECVAFLHDAIEDTEADFEDIAQAFSDLRIRDPALGTRIADLVSLISDDKRKPKEQREAEYLTAIQNAPIVIKLVKLADVLDNLRDIACLPEKQRAGFRRKCRAILQVLHSDERIRAATFFQEALKRAVDEE